MNKLPLSILILTHRSDQRFLNCLKSIQKAEEIIILDNNSQNDWPKLKEQNSFKVIKYPKEIFDFSEPRNFLISQAKYNWVLFLDSDEEITPNSWNEIKKIIESKNLDAAYIKRLDFFQGKQIKWGETRNNWILRLAKKHELIFLRSVHELGHVAGNIKHSKIIIKHYPHKNISEFLKKITRYAQIEAQIRTKTNKAEIIFELLTYPVAKFFVNFILKLGFLDGFRGLIYASVMSVHSLSARVFWYEKYFAKKN